MSNNDILKAFYELFPDKASNIDTWFHGEKHIIRLKMVDKTELMFTFNGPKDWKLETISSYLRRQGR